MNTKGIRTFFVTCLIMGLVGSLLVGCGGETDSFQSPLSILGDIHNPLILNDLAEAPITQKLKYKEETITVVPLEHLIQEAGALGNHYEILFVARDGFSALITDENLTECYLALSSRNGWEAINLKHPVSSNIKNIKEIVIICKDMSIDNYFNVIEQNKDIANLSVGELYISGYSLFSTVRGTATVDNDGQELIATTYYMHKAIDIEDYVNLDGRETVLVIGEKGEVETLRQDGRFILGNNSLGYMAGEELIIPRVKGIVLDPPPKRVTDVYHDAKAALAEGSSILVILVDGLGYHQYQYASANGYTPFMDTLPNPEPSMSVYPSITPVNVAASLSGALPHVNGVWDRRTRQLNVPTLFSMGGEERQVMTAVFGPLGTIELEVEPVFSVDRNDDGSADDEKTEYTLEIIDGYHDLLFVHYKDVDSTGHDYGDLHEKTMEEIRETDDYIRQLVSHWKGKVLIYADHGMYATETGGTHGALVYKSMFTPYWLFETEDN